MHFTKETDDKESFSPIPGEDALADSVSGFVTDMKDSAHIISEVISLQVNKEYILHQKGKGWHICKHDCQDYILMLVV